jgi:hypothetical protein
LTKPNVLERNADRRFLHTALFEVGIKVLFANANRAATNANSKMPNPMLRDQLVHAALAHA